MALIEAFELHYSNNKSRRNINSTTDSKTTIQRPRFRKSPQLSLRSHTVKYTTTIGTGTSSIGAIHCGILLFLLLTLETTLTVVAFTVISRTSTKPNTGTSGIRQRHYHLDQHYPNTSPRRCDRLYRNDKDRYNNRVHAASAVIASSVVMASTSMQQQQQHDHRNDNGTVSTTTNKCTTTTSSLPTIMNVRDTKEEPSRRNEENVVNHDSQLKKTVKIVVYGIRHGRSLSNEWMNGENEWGTASYNDRNNIRDSPLSEHGVLQAQQLYQQLRNEINAATQHGADNKNTHWLYNVDMILVSPLTRCLQTYKYAIEPLLSFDTSISIQQPSLQPLKSPRPYVHPLLTERLYSVSEMGRSVLELQIEFPDMDWSCFEDDTLNYNDIWWYDPTVPTPYNTICKNSDENDINVDDNTVPGSLEKYKEWRPYGDGQFYMCPGEPEIVFQRRMEALRLWINLHVFTDKQNNQAEGDASLPNSSSSNQSVEPRIINVLTIGHWGVYKYFTNGSELENCQICAFDL